MAQDDRTVESAVDGAEAARSGDDAADSDATSPVGDDGGRTGDERVDSDRGHDDAAESFLELEAALDGTTRPTGTHAEGERVRGLVTAAERRNATELPEEYPLDAETDRVLALTVDLGDDEPTVFLDWPGEDATPSPLRRFLDAADIRLGDLYGRPLLVERTGRHYAVVTPSERPRSSGDWGLGVAGGHVLNVALLGALVATGGLPAALYPVWALLAFVVLPYATYEDAWYVRTHSDWDHGPLFWATLSALPVLNVPAGLAYLWTRRRAAFLGSEPSLFTRAGRRVRSVL